jgi:elongation factor G
MSQAQPQRATIIAVLVRPKASDDWENLRTAVISLSDEDPVMTVAEKLSAGHIVIGGVNELHLNIICDSLEREFKVPLDVEPPQVLYWETVTRHSEAEGKYIRQLGGQGHYAHVKLSLDPGDQGSGYQFSNETSEDAVPHRFIESIQAGIGETMRAGVGSANEIVDIKAVLRHGSYHLQDSNEIAFKAAAVMAFTDAFREASPVTLEPFMSVEISIQEDFVGMLLADLNLRRACVKEMDAHPSSVVIHAEAPLNELIGYYSHLRMITQGKASSDIQFLRYEPFADGSSGSDDMGVPANNPRYPIGKSASAIANPESVDD